MRFTIPCILLLLLAAVPAAVAEPLDRSATSPAHAVWRAAPAGVLALPESDAPPAPSGKTAERTPAPLLRAAGPSPDADDYDVIEPEHWRTITLSLDLSHGGHCDITLLRPLPWIASTGAAVGGTVALDMPEMGVSGAARVVAIEPCPPIGPPAPGARPITGTFVTTRASVIDLSIEGLAQPLGTTASHPFWSLDRAGWVAAGDLQPGEKLRTVAGSAAVRSVSPRPGTETVYNLEVHRAHTYFVSDAKLWVHNNCGRSLNEVSLAIRKGQAPRSISRLDHTRLGPHEKPHIHFTDGHALNIDGTWKHGGRALTNAERRFLLDNGWTAP